MNYGNKSKKRSTTVVDIRNALSYCRTPVPKNKYKSRKTEMDGVTFDSLKEANRYRELKILERCGKIKDLELQKMYELIPEQRDPTDINKRTKKGKVIERRCAYLADFVYIDVETGKRVVEDVKSKPTRTAEYKIKKKLMLWIHGIRIKEMQ